MRSVLYAFVAIVMMPISASAASFSPKLVYNCDPGTIKPGEHGQIVFSKLLGNVLQNADVKEMEVSDGKGFSFADKKSAILDSDGYCSKPGQCKPVAAVVVGKLRTASVDLYNFIQRSRKGISKPEASGYFEIYRKDGTTRPITVDELLSDSLNITARCVVPKLKGDSPGGAADQKKPNETENAPPDKTPVTSRFMIRKKVADLQYSQDDKDKFKALDRASLSIVDDYVKRTVTYNIDGVAGFGLAHVPLGSHADVDFVGYGTYTRSTFVSAVPKTKQEVDNVGAGLLANFFFPAGGDYHGLQIAPQYLQSRVSDGQIFSTSVVYSPMTWPLVGQPIPLADHLVGVLTPQAKFVYGQVLDHGRDPTFVANKDFERAGGRIEFLAVADGGLFNGFSWRNAYEYQYVIQGKYKSVDRFESTISYKFPEQQYWSLDLAYVSGRNLDTLEFQQQLTLGVGLKY